METIQYLEPGAHESLSPTTSTGITSAVVQPTSGEYKNLHALTALITVEDNSIRFTVDGTTPTNATGTSADVGHLMTSGQNYIIENRKGVASFRCIDAVSGSASAVKVTTFFKRR